MTKTLMTMADERAFNNLLVTWGSHQDLKAKRAPLIELYHSRLRLDEARRRVRNKDSQFGV